MPSSSSSFDAMPGSEEDAGKKRQVHPIEDETPKKVRIEEIAPKRSAEPTSIPSLKVPPPPTTPSSSTNVASKPKTVPAAASAQNQPSPSGFNVEKIKSLWKDKNRRVWDLEGALLFLVQELEGKEYLTHDETVWTTFRMGHAGDASKVASWYRLAKQRVLEQEAQEKKDLAEHDGDNDPEIEIDRVAHHTPTAEALARVEEEEGNELTSTSMLEMWLADGFGDDRRLPSVYGLMADVLMISDSTSKDEAAESSSHSPSDQPGEEEEQKEEANRIQEAKVDESSIDTPTGDLKKSSVTKELGAVALLTMGFDEGLEKVLRIEWLGLNPDLSTEVLTMLRQRLWLRLSTLAVMMACCGGMEWEQRFSLDPLQQPKEQEKKQQELQETADESPKKPAARVSPRAE